MTQNTQAFFVRGNRILHLRFWVIILTSGLCFLNLPPLFSILKWFCCTRFQNMNQGEGQRGAWRVSKNNSQIRSQGELKCPGTLEQLSEKGEQWPWTQGAWQAGKAQVACWQPSGDMTPCPWSWEPGLAVTSSPAREHPCPISWRPSDSGPRGHGRAGQGKGHRFSQGGLSVLWPRGPSALGWSQRYPD